MKFGRSVRIESNEGGQMDRKKVLIVDDEKDWHDNWFKTLQTQIANGEIALVSAISIREAEDQFEADPDIAAIVMDTCVPGYRPNTMSLVRKFRSVFTGPMIAVSSDKSERRQLVGVGCNYESTKPALPAKLLGILGL
jgi:CheY-like chemotaxis protein